MTSSSCVTVLLIVLLLELTKAFTGDIVFVQDVTYSYKNDMPQFQEVVPKLIAEMRKWTINSRFGFTTFGDKPLLPYGRSSSGDYCYKLHQPLTDDSTAVIAAASNIRIVSGGDWKESQLDAMMSAALDPSMGWREGRINLLFRMVILATDSGYHEAPAAQKSHSLRPHSEGMVNCKEEDYPTWRMVVKALMKKGLHPLFVTTSDVASTYRKLVEEMKNRFEWFGAVVELKNFSDFTQLPLLVSEGAKRLLQMVEDQGSEGSS